LGHFENEDEDEDDDEKESALTPALSPRRRSALWRAGRRGDGRRGARSFLNRGKVRSFRFYIGGCGGLFAVPAAGLKAGHVPVTGFFAAPDFFHQSFHIYLFLFRP